MKSRIARGFCVSWALALGAACGGSQQSAAPAATAAEPPAEAVVGDGAPGAEAEKTPEAAAPTVVTEKSVHVAFLAKSGSQLAGSGTLTETGEGVSVSLALENVPPGEHGAHVHEKGDCSAPDAASAGGHFNPASHPHALPASSPRHLGDLGNINIGADGKGTIDILAPGANLKPNDPSSFLGKAIIIHEKKDDGGQPTGNAGGRIGCAPIE
jgi:Cu-Zn family superoxide dismutase